MKSTLTSEPPRRRAGQQRPPSPRDRPAPLGATVSPTGVNFSIFSKHATGLELLLFDRDDDARPARVIPIDPATNRQYHYWHVFVPGLRAGTDLRVPRVRARSTPRTGIGSIRKRSCSIRTDARSSCRRATTARPPHERGTTPRRR